MDSDLMIEEIKNKSINLGFSRIELVKTEIINTNIIWIQLLLYDNDVLPIKLDILKSIYIHPIKTIYSSPGSALNTESNFITPKNKNLAVFLVNKGYLFIGITPREDASPLEFNFELMKDWGLAKHTEDFSKIITLFQNIENREYDVLGHSAGALNVLNYCSTSSTRDKKLKAKLNVARIIDVVGQYPPNSQEFINSQISLNAVNQLINRGIFVNNEFVGFKYITEQAQINPNGDSGVPRPVGGNFTNEGLLYFSLIFTGQLPGQLTEITGLPSSWYLQSYLTGSYEFGNTPIEDRYSLNHTKIETVYSAINSIGSGIYPLAYERDFYAIWSNSYPLNWKNIRVPVFYTNAESGFGDVSHTISLIRNVTFDIIRNYGHADLVYSETADIDFWNKFI